MVLIIGAGVIGLSIGWMLARQGASITILEEGLTGRKASWASAGMLAPRIQSDQSTPGVSRKAREVVNLKVASKALWKDFASSLEAESGLKTGYRLGGSLTVALKKDEEAELEAQFKAHQDLDLKMEWKSPKEAFEIEPNLSHDLLLAAVFSPDDGQVDPRSVLAALREAFLRAGGELKEHSPVDAIEISSNRVRGAVVHGKLVQDEQIVVAAGAWSGSIYGLPDGARPPVHPAKGQMIAARLDRRNPLLRHIVFRTHQYYIPRSEERMIIGATFEEVGFDTEITAGGMLELLRQVSETFPAVLNLPITETWTGLRPRSSDDAPILGPTSVEGLTMATGHFHIGIILTPITARTISEYVLTNRVPEMIRPFTIDRFQGL